MTEMNMDIASMIFGIVFMIVFLSLGMILGYKAGTKAGEEKATIIYTAMFDGLLNMMTEPERKRVLELLGSLHKKRVAEFKALLEKARS